MLYSAEVRMDREHGVVNFGKMGPAEFVDAVRRSKVMVGVGNPWWSPSPYHALCQGVPFVNPVSRLQLLAGVSVLIDLI